MTLPSYDEEKHDFGLGGKGYMRVADAYANRADAVPGTARSVQGEGRYDYFPADAFLAMADFGGGVGQGRLVKADTLLSGVGDGRFQGHFFPARLSTTSNDGGVTSYYFVRDGVLYGLTDSAIETIVDSGATTSQARTSGTVYCQPVVTGANNVMWTQDDSGTRKVAKWSGTGAPTFVTPTGVSPYVVDGYGRVIYCIGKRTKKATSGIRQSTITTSSSTNVSHSISLPDVGQAGNVLLALVVISDTSVTVPTAPSGWTEIPGVTGTVGNLYAYYKTLTSTDQKNIVIAKSGAGTSRVALIELEGIDTSAPLWDSVTTTDASADTTIISGTLATPSSNCFTIFFAVLSDDTAAVNTASNHTELDDTDMGSKRCIIQYRSETTETDFSVSVTGGGGAPSVTDANMFIAFNGNAITADLTQTVFLFTRDDGATWEENFNDGDSAGIPAPIAAYATQGAMWVSTVAGMYRVIAEEKQFEDQLQTIALTIDDVGDKFSVPYDTAALAHTITSFGNFLYYPIGSTIWELPPPNGPGGGSGRQVWPPREWDTTTGEVQGMCSGEAGLFWGAGGYLWNYDGRGFHCLATEPSAGAFDTLFWHAGRLYFKGDPAPYFNFRQPSTRPDVSFTAPDNFTDGYMVLPYWDADKVDEIKVVRQFFLQCEWSASSASGTLTLAYFIGDTGTHPERIGGGVTSSVTWTTIGTMTIADGNTKRFSLATPIEFKKLYLRVKLEKGASGYPIVEAVGANGRVKMPDQKVFTLPISVSTRTLDRTGAVMYPDTATVNEALDALDALRAPSASPYYTTLNWTNAPSDNDAYLVTVDNAQESITGFFHDNTVSAVVNVQCTELPG